MSDKTKGTCEFCGDTEHTGPSSTVCVTCTFNPKRRREYAGERNASVHIEDDDE